MRSKAVNSFAYSDSQRDETPNTYEAPECQGEIEGLRKRQSVRYGSNDLDSRFCFNLT